MRPAFYIPIQGTNSWDENPNHFQWWEELSVFSEYLKGLGLVQLNPLMPFEWSTELDGVWGSHRVWKGAAKALMYYVGEHFSISTPNAPIPYENRNFIAHSHGGQVALYSAAWGMRIRNLITVGTPVRGDMEKVYEAARKNISYHLHICDSRNDLIAVLGAIRDGKLRIRHDFPGADRNDNCRDLKVSHSRVLNDPNKFGLWKTRGWAEALTRG
jgi:hypothetical protein